MPRPKSFNRDKVVQQAMDVFWEKGYEATSITDITDATNLKPGSIYNTFGSKHALYLEALDFYEVHVGGKLFAVLDESVSGINAIRNLFAKLIESELSDQRGCFMHNAMIERATCDEDVEKRACIAKEQGTAIFKHALDRAVEYGEISNDKNTDEVALYLVGTVYAVRSLARVTNQRSELEQVVNIALSILI